MATTADRGSRAGSSDPLGSIGWTERTGGVLTARECVTLARPLLREELGILAGLLAMALRVHSGRRATIEPARLAPPDSSLARGAQEAAEDLLTPVLRNHSHRAYAWAAAIAARRGISFDRELLYLAAMFHDTGLPSPVPHVDFTVRSAALAREFADRHGVPADSREVVTNAIAMHHTPGVGLESGPEAYLMSAGAAVDVFGSRSNEIPDAFRRRVVEQFPRYGGAATSWAHSSEALGVRCAAHGSRAARRWRPTVLDRRAPSGSAWCWVPCCGATAGRETIPSASCMYRPAAQTRPGSRSVSSCSSQRFPSGSLNDAYEA